MSIANELRGTPIPERIKLLKKTCRDFSALTDKVFLIFGQLLVFSGIVADYNQPNLALFCNFVEGGVVNDWIFERIIWSVFLRRVFLKRN